MNMIWSVILAAGIPSAIVGVLIGRLNRRISKSDAAREEKENNRLKYEIMTLNLIMASISLSEATAEAVQRIPDAHCNGEMEDALNNACEMKKKYKEFERTQAIKSVN